MPASQLSAVMAASDLPRSYLCLPAQEHSLVWLLALCALMAIASALCALVALARLLRQYSALRRELLSDHSRARSLPEDHTHPMYRGY